jgi:hypothetical protein
LLEIKLDAVAKREVLFERHSQWRTQIDRLAAYEGKMARVDSELYKARIDRAEKARTALSDSLRRDEPLLVEYGRIVDMVDVELESAALDATPSGEPHKLVFDRVEEVRRLEAARQDLHIEVEANEDVEALLGAG